MPTRLTTEDMIREAIATERVDDHTLLSMKENGDLEELWIQTMRARIFEVIYQQDNLLLKKKIEELLSKINSKIDSKDPVKLVKLLNEIGKEIEIKPKIKKLQWGKNRKESKD